MVDSLCLFGVCLSTFDYADTLTGAFEAAGDQSSKKKLICVMRSLALGFTELNHLFQAFLDERPLIPLTFSELSKHVTTLAQVDKHGHFCRAFFAGLEDRIYHCPEPKPVAVMPSPVAALTDGMLSTNSETT